MKTLMAYTAPGAYPEYVSITEDEDGIVEITVRSKRSCSCADTPTAACSQCPKAPVASIRLTREAYVSSGVAMQPQRVVTPARVGGSVKTQPGVAR